MKTEEKQTCEATGETLDKKPSSAPSRADNTQ